MNSIYIRNSQSAVEITPITRGIVRKAVNAALKYEKVKSDAEVSVTFTDNEGIKELNRDFRNIDRETDVLSFPLFENIEQAYEACNDNSDDADNDIEIDVFDNTEDEKSKKLPLGDIVVSLEKAMSQAEEYGHSFERELAFLCVHSVLHLLGYDHETSEADEKQMFAKQEEILHSIGLER